MTSVGSAAIAADLWPARRSGRAVGRRSCGPVQVTAGSRWRERLRGAARRRALRDAPAPSTCPPRWHVQILCKADEYLTAPERQSFGLGDGSLYTGRHALGI